MYWIDCSSVWRLSSTSDTPNSLWAPTRRWASGWRRSRSTSTTFMPVRAKDMARLLHIDVLPSLALGLVKMTVGRSKSSNATLRFERRMRRASSKEFRSSR